MINQQDNTASSDEVLIAEAVSGNKESLTILIKRHQDFIYNVALRMFLHPDDALDATQEVLIKVVTRLNTFKSESKFRTWLYRIVVNHFLNSTTRKMEKLFDRNTSVNNETSALVSNPTNEISEEEIEEVRIMCSNAMLMCLNREQRLIYIIGEIFGADHQLGSELFETSPGNFRIKLHRAKSDLLNYVSGKCGLLNPENPCRCHKKAKGMIAQGMVNKDKLIFNAHFQRKVNEIVIARKDQISDEVQLKMIELFQDSPFQVRKDLDKLFSDILR
jgi:RNA polymerase sigma factor (sigma-70 family)